MNNQQLDESKVRYERQKRAEAAERELPNGFIRGLLLEQLTDQPDPIFMRLYNAAVAIGGVLESRFPPNRVLVSNYALDDVQWRVREFGQETRDNFAELQEAFESSGLAARFKKITAHRIVEAVLACRIVTVNGPKFFVNWQNKFMAESMNTHSYWDQDKTLEIAQWLEDSPEPSPSFRKINLD